jgi:beta-galactosidase
MNKPLQSCCFALILMASTALLSAASPDLQTGSSLPREHSLFTTGWSVQKDDPAGVGDALSYGKIKPWLLPNGNAFRKELAAVPAGTPPGEDVSYVQPGFDDSSWRKLNLPHDWGIEGPFDQALPGETGKLPWAGVAWYRKSFDLPASDKGETIALEIDGAMSYATVWCNGKFVGGWPYGYSSWQLDLTPFVKFGGENILAIRLDNPRESSRWYPGGGIYRNVWLTKTSPVHVAHWGTTVTTPSVREMSADVSVKTRVVNDSASEATIEVATTIVPLDSKGKTSGTSLSLPSATVKISAGGTQTVDVSRPLASPLLWDTEHPNLYAAVTALTQDGRVVDRYQTTFGIRTVEFTVKDGFHLNGKKVPIRGVCMHHDLGALGAAINTRALERQIEILKEMGVNAIRTSHNPPAPELLDLCDRMGILVMDESFDCWQVPKKPNGYNLLFSDWSEADLRAEVRRDRNHPSIILWSIGNEIPEQSKPEGVEMAKRLSSFVHEEDPTRPTTFACSDTKGGYNGFQKGVDVFGYNYKPWEYQKFREANPSEPIFGSETASTISSRCEYLFPVSNEKGGGKIGYQMSSYDLYAPGWASTPDSEFKGQEQNPFVAGEFVWTGFDYLGEPTPYSADVTNLLNYHTPEEKAKAEAELKAAGKIKVPSRSSYFGIVDLAGFKKDRFYLYQAHWRPDLPMAHILPHWNWPDRVGQVTPVHVYTSGDEAELFLNGQSLGRKKKGPLEYRLRWDDVVYQPGELKVVAYKNGHEWATDVVKTTGEAAKLKLTTDRGAMKADGLDLSFVTATVADKEGNLVPGSRPKLKFSVAGPGEIVATDNGDATDHTTFSSAERNAFNGLALAILRTKPGATSPIILRVESEGLKPDEIVLTPITP